MIPAVRIVAVPFYFLSWYEEPFTVLASLRVDLTVDDFNFGRITVGHIAAGTKPTGKSWMILSFCLGRMEDDWRLSAVIGLVAEPRFDGFTLRIMRSATGQSCASPPVNRMAIRRPLISASA